MHNGVFRRELIFYFFFFSFYNYEEEKQKGEREKKEKNERELFKCQNYIDDRFLFYKKKNNEYLIISINAKIKFICINYKYHILAYFHAK